MNNPATNECLFCELQAEDGGCCLAAPRKIKTNYGTTICTDKVRYPLWRRQAISASYMAFAIAEIKEHQP